MLHGLRPRIPGRRRGIGLPGGGRFRGELPRLPIGKIDKWTLKGELSERCA